MNKKNNLNQPHDAFFKALFSRIEAAQEYIRNFLPSTIVEKLHLEKLKLEKDSFVSPELASHFSDLVYTCPFGAAGEKVQLSLLLEHKSNPEPFPYLQLLRYMLNIWNNQIKSKKALTPIIPIIFYHGTKQWPDSSFEDMFKHSDPLLVPFMPSFKYILTDLKKYPDEFINRLRFHFLVNSLLVFKHYKDQDYLKQHFGIFFNFPEDLQDKDFILSLLVYLFKITEIRGEEIPDLIEEAPKDIKEMIMNTYNNILQKGLEQGLEQGLVRGLQQGMEQGLEQGLERGHEQGSLQKTILTVWNMHKEGFSNDLIAKLLSIEQEQVEEILSHNES